MNTKQHDGNNNPAAKKHESRTEAVLKTAEN